MSEELWECKYSVLTSLKKTYYKKKHILIPELNLSGNTMNFPPTL